MFLSHAVEVDLLLNRFLACFIYPLKESMTEKEIDDIAESLMASREI